MRYRGGLWYFFPRALGKLIKLARMVVENSLHRMSLGEIGVGTKFYPGVRIQEPAAVKIGNNCLFLSGVEVSSEIPGSSLRVGDNVQINEKVRIDITGGMEIGDGVLISSEVIIYTHDHGLDPRSIPNPLPKKIGDNAWIGIRAIILPNCIKIGEGSIIGAGSVVTKNVLPYTIVAGNPAKIIKELK